MYVGECCYGDNNIKILSKGYHAYSYYLGYKLHCIKTILQKMMETSEEMILFKLVYVELNFYL